MQNFQIPSIEEDVVAKILYPADAPSDLTPVKVYGDGNCLFRSISLALYGSESHHIECRVRTIVELTSNFQLYCDENTYKHMLGTTESCIDYIIMSSASDENVVFGNVPKTLEKEILKTIKNGTYCSVVHLFALANVCKIPVQSIYPRVNSPTLNRNINNGIIKPLSHSKNKDPDTVLNIMWTHVTNNKFENWEPNHFVPCLNLTNSNAKVCNEHSSNDNFSRDDTLSTIAFPGIKTNPSDTCHNLESTSDDSKNPCPSSSCPDGLSSSCPDDLSSSCPDDLSSSCPDDLSSSCPDDLITSQGPCTSEKDISDYTSPNAKFSDEDIEDVIENRKPSQVYKFPPKQYKLKSRKCGFVNRSCLHEWFLKFDFIAYSKKCDGLFCLACVFFPDTSHRRPKKLISEPYQNWKDAQADLSSHSTCDYHKSSMAKLLAFKTTNENPAARIDVSISDSNSSTVSRNREILKSIIKCLEFCGRQGIALRGHRDDETSSSFNHGNFKALLDLRIDAGDTTIENHLKTCAKNARYTSKTAQNELLLCIKEYIQSLIVNEIKSQAFGPFYGYQCDEVTDSSNWEQLGLVVRYTQNNKPIERLLEFVSCEEITGEAICNNVVSCLTKLGLNIQNCRSQTMDGAGNMAGKHSGCAARFTQLSPKACYFYCSSHDLNLALCKSCNVKEVHLMLDTIKKIGIFFKYSPKRSRRLEAVIDSWNMVHPDETKKKKKMKLFCQTRWVEKHTTLIEFDELYECILECLDNISMRETDWDTKTSGEAYGLMKKITDSVFIVAFNTVIHFFGYIKGLSVQLQGSSLDVIQGYGMVSHVRSVISEARNNTSEFNSVFESCVLMANKANTTISIPRICGRQTQRSNISANSPSEYYRLNIYLAFVDSLNQQLSLRFNDLTHKAVKTLNLLPSNLDNLEQQTVESIFELFETDMPSPDNFSKEVKLWNQTWRDEEKKPNSITDTLQMRSVFSPKMFPNINAILHLLLLHSVTSCGVERSNSSLKFVKSAERSTMGEDRFNALVLLFVHKDIPLDLDKIIDAYAKKHPRRMLF
mgnify:FL=1